MRFDLPDEFVQRMSSLFRGLGRENELEAFIYTFSESPGKGIRFNRNKTNGENVFSGIVTAKVPWSDDGWYLPEDFHPGRHPYYHAGLFYIQEPSAMLPAMLAKACPGDRVLDLCAAPGGKSVKLSSDMRGEGLLISNDISTERVRPLVRNIELAGCSNCVVANEPPNKLSAVYPEFFDIVLVDAPCSGEGMFRRDQNALKNWNKYKDDYPVTQLDILSEAASMLKPGGRLVYSTCTFSLEENEKVIDSFLSDKMDYMIEDIFAEGYLDEIPDLHKTGISRGLKIAGSNTDMTARIFPHDIPGDGHYCAVLRKNDNSEKIDHETKNLADIKNREEIRNAFHDFADDVLSEEDSKRIDKYFSNHLACYKDHIYTLNVPVRLPDNINMPKKGFFVGRLNRSKAGVFFEPSHQLVMSLGKGDHRRMISFSHSSMEIAKYLKGETIFFSEDPADLSDYQGYVIIAVDGHPLGWGKKDRNGMIKNLYPKGWRRS
ncbi:SAM-dependent methyltransferase [Candidatus Nomurabacteria bacterium]|nr:SAM-dependent methyltransferase [Candidatus Nomurabacteria bacterium]